MDILLTVLIGLLGLCVGAIIGFGIDFKINRTYILEMIDLEKRIFRYNYDRFSKSSR